jgi:hypothetical protein
MNSHQKVPYAMAPVGSRTMRFYYYASPLADGRWELQSSRKAEPARYAGRAQAMAAAAANCRKQWEQHGTPFGIRVRDSHGAWMDVLLLDGTEPSPGASPA